MAFFDAFGVDLPKLAFQIVAAAVHG